MSHLPLLFILLISLISSNFFFFFFNDTATTEIYTLSLHDALPIWHYRPVLVSLRRRPVGLARPHHLPCFRHPVRPDRKSTRLNSSHTVISYAVFCLKKKKNQYRSHILRFQNT